VLVPAATALVGETVFAKMMVRHFLPIVDCWLRSSHQLRSSKFSRGCEMYQEATIVERPFEYDVPMDNGNMRFGVAAHHKY